MKWDFVLKRRKFLISAGAWSVALCTFGAGWVAQRVRPAQAQTTSNAGSDENAPAIPPETIPILLAVADIIVPRYGDSPAASEIDLLPRLQRLIDASPSLTRSYRKNWVKLAKIIQDEVPVVDGKPEPKELARHLRIYHRRFRRTRSGGDLGNAFEQLRRDVLGIYYTSPEGRAWVGYSGRQAGHGGGAS